MSSVVLGLVRARASAAVMVVTAVGVLAVAAVGSRPDPAPLKNAAGSELYVPGAAHVAGAIGTNWRSDLELYNVSAQQASYEIALLEHGRPNPSPATVAFSLGPGASVRYRDVLDTVFGSTGSAALRIRASSGALVATCRTFNQTDAGTYGQFISGVEPSDGFVRRDDARIIQLTHNRSSSDGFRTNLGYVNLSGTGYWLTVEYYLANGVQLGTTTHRLDPFEFRQVNRAFEEVTSSDVLDGYVVVRAFHAEARYLAYASVVDNRTGDPVYIPAQGADAPAGPVSIMAAAHVAGSGGTQWRTDLELHNPGDRDLDVVIAMLETGADNTAAPTVAVTLGGGESRRFEDVLASQFGFTGSAALRIIPAAGTVLATSRTYNLTPDGTYGQFIGGVPEASALTAGESAALIQLSDLRGDGGARTNVGFVNTTAAPVAVRATGWLADRTPLGFREWRLEPYGHLQVNRLLGQLTSDPVEDAVVVVSTSTAGAAFLAYASVVDNDTGDPILVPFERIASDTPPTPTGPPGDTPTPTRTPTGPPGDTPTPTVTPTPTGGAPADPVEPVNVAGYLSVWFGSVPGTADFPGLVQAVDDWQTAGFGSLLAEVEATDPGLISVSGTSVTVDYGGGTTLPDGTVVSGSMQIEFTNLDSSSGHVGFDVAGSAPSLVIGGQDVSVDSAQGSLSLDVAPDGHAAGRLTFSGSSAKRSASVVGSFDIDTAICERFPTGGSVTITAGDDTHTITIPDTCNGGYDYDGWDFQYEYGDIRSAHARQYHHSVTNAELWEEGAVVQWIPSAGGPTLGSTPPGEIVYRFPFGGTATAARLLTRNPTFHWSYSRGHNFVYASRNGVDWELLLEVPPPDYGEADGGVYHDLLPDAVLGGTELWLRILLHAYGDRAEDGPPWTNTSQHSRNLIDNPSTVFRLQVRTRDP